MFDRTWWIGYWGNAIIFLQKHGVIIVNLWVQHHKKICKASATYDKKFEAEATLWP